MSRTRREGSLPTALRAILNDARTPLPNEVLRLFAIERLEKKVSAEQLARVAAYEREAFLRTRMPPALCSVIDPRAVALRPRVWALGEWRLARRIATPDVQRHWQSGLALMLLDEILLRFPPASERLQRLTLEAVARVLGPVAAYTPGGREQWEELRRLVAVENPDPDPTGHTSEQWEAEQALMNYQPSIAASDLYFGIELSVMTRTESYPEKLRLPAEGEVGTPFDEVASRRLGGDEVKTRELLAYLQGWSLVRDELGRAPSSTEYADHWEYDQASVRAEEALFAKTFPEEDSPERIIRLLENGLPRSGQLVRMMGVAVVDSDETRAVSAPAPGQRWRRHDGAVLTLTTVEGSAVIGRLEESQGDNILWASGRDKLLKEFQLELPQDLWLVTFDVDVPPTDLLDLFAAHQDIELERFRRPSDPRPHQNFLRVGTIQLQVVALDAGEARTKVIDALRGRLDLRGEEVRVRSLNGTR